MTDPNDDLSSVADPGSMGPDDMTQPNNESPAEKDDSNRTGPDGTPDSQALQGGPPD